MTDNIRRHDYERRFYNLKENIRLNQCCESLAYTLYNQMFLLGEKNRDLLEEEELQMYKEKMVLLKTYIKENDKRLMERYLKRERFRIIQRTTEVMQTIHRLESHRIFEMDTNGYILK